MSIRKRKNREVLPEYFEDGVRYEKSGSYIIVDTDYKMSTEKITLREALCDFFSALSGFCLRLIWRGFVFLLTLAVYAAIFVAFLFIFGILFAVI